MAVTPGHLEAETIGHPPQARCYQCGTAQISRMCHHCGRVGCTLHILPTPVIADRPLNREHARLGMGSKPAYHCSACMHGPSVTTFTARAAGLVLTLAGAAVLALSLAAGLILIALGLAALAAGYVPGYRARARRAVLPLPVLPKIRELKLREELTGHITLPPGLEYRETIGSMTGAVTAALVLGRPDRNRLDRYLRMRRLPPGTAVPFTAGALVLRGPAGIDTSGSFPGLVIPLHGTTSDYPVFTAEDSASSPYRASYSYGLAADRKDISIPVWITPAIAPRSARQALELHIQWVGTGLPESQLELEKVDSLTLQVPVRWGKMEHATRPGTMSTHGRQQGHQVVRDLEWAQLRPDPGERQRQRLELVIRFENQIIPEDPASEEPALMTGRLDAILTGSLSGLTGAGLYGPLGARRSTFSSERPSTRMVLDFELSLAGIRYQEARLVPDRKVPEDQERTQPSRFPGVIPDDETVIRLTNALSDAGYYVKRVIENPPRSGAQAQLVQRYWDIAGRRYEGVYPVDFHIVLTGEEIHLGGIRAHSGTTETRITVWGSYANTEMRRIVERQWDTLRQLTEDTLREPCTSQQGGDQGASGAWQAGGLPGSNGNGATSDRMHDSARLLDLLIRLEEALQHGRISEERYWEMREHAEQEFRGESGRPGGEES